MYVRLLDGRDRGHVVEVNREIGLDLVERKQALALEDVTRKDSFEPWSHEELKQYLESSGEIETKVPAGVSEVLIPASIQSAEVSTPRAKAKKR